MSIIIPIYSKSFPYHPNEWPWRAALHNMWPDLHNLKRESPVFTGGNRLYIVTFDGSMAAHCGDMAIWTGSQEIRARALPKLEQLRIYARLNNVVDVKGNGPFGSIGSKLDSGVLCQAVFHLRRAFLIKRASCKRYIWNWHLKEARVPTYTKIVL